MASRLSVLGMALLVSSCAGIRPVQLRPPLEPPAGLVWGYGVEKVRHDAGESRQLAYLKAMDDLLSRGPVLVSRTVADRTTVTSIKAASRTMESTFRLRASRILQPDHLDTGIEDGFVWVLVGTTDTSIEKGWQEFIDWRAEKIDQARELFHQTDGTDRVPRLKASLALLDEVGAQEDLNPFFYEVQAALDAEQARIAKLEELEREIRQLIASGRLGAAEGALDQATKVGLDSGTHQRTQAEIGDRRREADRLARSGDELFGEAQYREALEEYQRAQSLDRDNPQLAEKLATAEREHRTARSAAIRSTIGTVSISAGRIVGEYFAYKREEEKRKREEAEREKKKAEEESAERERSARRQQLERRRQVEQTPPPEQHPEAEQLPQTDLPTEPEQTPEPEQPPQPEQPSS